MQKSIARLDDDLADNLALAAHVSNMIVLSGSRQFDRVMVRDATVPRIITMERLCHESMGAQATWRYDPATRRVCLERANAAVSAQTSLPLAVGGEREVGSLANVIDAVIALPGVAAIGRCALIVDADLLMEDAAAPRDEDFHVLQLIEHFSRSGCGHVVVLRVSRSGNLAPIVLASPHVKVVHIPMASRDVRYAYAAARGHRLAERCHADVAAAAETMTNATEGWSLSQLDALVETAGRQGVSRLSELEDLARAVRLGTTQSPWAGERIRQEIVGAPQSLTDRVSGQPAAVEAVVSALRKAVVGLSDAHQSQGSSSPRGVFFFAGPTGSGKTELAKAISRLIFGQDDLLRFDCGEFRQEHTVSRLIGSAPGYVGYDRGGELTDGILKRPNSVVLFDEIEKAHPRMLDVLLGVLDDGRLTSGQGQTAYFGQAVLIFTSNLGIYEEVADRHGRQTRRPRFDYDTPFEVIQRTVREAIRDEFVTGLGRPELLGRFGGPESIIVFDYLREPERVCQKFIANIAEKCRNLHGVTIDVDPSVIDAVIAASKQCPDTLLLGGRGLKSILDRLFTNPLADHLFGRASRQGGLRVHMHDRKIHFINGGA